MKLTEVLGNIMKMFLRKVILSPELYWKATRLTLSLSFQGDDLSGSFCLIPSGPEPSSSTLKKENASLKTELASMKSRLEATERILKLRKEQDLQLRDSIFMATREVRIIVSMGVNFLLSSMCSHLPCRHSELWAHLPCYNNGPPPHSTSVALTLMFQQSRYRE